MKRILVPCDFSKPAVQAFKFATNLARQSKGEIIILNIVELPVLRHGPVPINALEKVFLKGVKERINKDVESMIDKWGKGIKVSFTLDHGPVNHTIIRNVKKHKVDLVVMGSHGASGARELFIGSNAEKVVRFSPVPVITVKHNFKRSIKNIVFATDLNVLPKKVAAELKNLQAILKASIDIVFVNTILNFKTDDILRPLVTEFISQSGLRKNCSFSVFNDQDEVTGIRNFAKKMKADIVALPTHSKKGLSHFVFGSIAEDVTNHIECPIWTCSTES